VWCFNSGDGKIDWDEFLAVMAPVTRKTEKQRLKEIHKMFRAMDSNHDGVISFAEIGDVMNIMNTRFHGMITFSDPVVKMHGTVIISRDYIK